MKSVQERLVDMEVLAAEQERTIVDLSGQVTAQWKTIEELRRKLDALTDRFLVLEEQTAPEVAVTKPPHW